MANAEEEPDQASHENGDDLRNFFLVLYGFSIATIFTRLFSGQKSNILVYLNHQIYGNYSNNAIKYSLFANLVSISALIISTIVALRFVSWIRKNTTDDFGKVITNCLPLVLLVSLSPYCSFWLGTSLLTGLDPTFLEQLAKEGIVASPWWNSTYLFLYLQLTLAMWVLNELGRERSLKKNICLMSFVVIFIMLVFYFSAHLFSSKSKFYSLTYYALLNLSTLIVISLAGLFVARFFKGIRERLTSNCEKPIWMIYPLILAAALAVSFLIFLNSASSLSMMIVLAIC